MILMRAGIDRSDRGAVTLEAWHPELGTKSMKVVIGKGKKADVTARFSYKAN